MFNRLSHAGDPDFIFISFLILFFSLCRSEFLNHFSSLRRISLNVSFKAGLLAIPFLKFCLFRRSFLKKVYLFEREREKESTRRGGTEKEGERENPK